MPATAAAAAAAEAEVGAAVAAELLAAVEQPAVAAPIIDEFNNICIKSWLFLRSSSALISEAARSHIAWSIAVKVCGVVDPPEAVGGCICNSGLVDATAAAAVDVSRLRFDDAAVPAIAAATGFVFRSAMNLVRQASLKKFRV